ncbi:MAG TPA: hypothetical protein VGE02_08995 [Gemmatimonadales bacterium]
MDASVRGARSGGPSRWLVLAGVAVVLLFMAAMVSQYARASNAAAAADELRSQLALSRAEATLATAALEAQRGSHQAALGLASGFFTQLQSSASDAPPALRSSVSGILAQRDQTIALLSRGDPESAELLYRMLTGYRVALHGQTGAPPTR